MFRADQSKEDRKEKNPVEKASTRGQPFTPTVDKKGLHCWGKGEKVVSDENTSVTTNEDPSRSAFNL